MNNISQISVFEYREIEILGNLERIKLFFEDLDDKELCESLENERKNGYKRKKCLHNLHFSIFYDIIYISRCWVKQYLSRRNK